MTQAAVAANYFEGGRNLTRGASEDDHDLATIINNLVADIVAAPTAVALAADLASITGGAEGASLIGTDAKPNLGGATTVEGCLNALNTADSATAAELASVTGGSEGALLVGTDAKANLGASTTVEACLTNIDTKNPPARSSGVIPPAAVPAIGDGYVDTATGVEYGAVAAAVSGWRPRQDEDLGAVAAIVVKQSGVPVAGQQLIIGADTYTADGAGDFGFAVAAAEATMDNLIHCISNHSTENVTAAKLSTTSFAILSTGTPHGTPVAASPALAVAENLANYEISAANMNAAGGRAAGIRKSALRQVVVTAADVTAGALAMTFPFAVVGWRITARSTTGVFKGITETSSVPATALQTVLISIGTGATPIVNTDVVTVEAWS